MTAAQKKARETFLRAINYRKKHPGVTLKQAFAWAKGKKSVASVGVAKKKVARKKAGSAHTDTKSHNVNIRVVSGINKKRKLQHKRAVNNAIPALSVWSKTVENIQVALKDKSLNTTQKNKLRKELKWAKHLLATLKKMI